jgi:MerR family transcriptional regulator, copper efflux regulator
VTVDGAVEGGEPMGEALLRIGELAARAGVSTRTVDFYTSLALLVPARRTDGNFRLYNPGDVKRISLIRRLEDQGIRLEDIARALAPSPEGVAEAAFSREDTSTERTDAGATPEQLELRRQLSSLEEQVRALHEVADAADPRTRGLLATLTARAQAMITTAVMLGSELAGEIATELEHFHPL